MILLQKEKTWQVLDPKKKTLAQGSFDDIKRRERLAIVFYFRQLGRNNCAKLSSEDGCLTVDMEDLEQIRELKTPSHTLFQNSKEAFAKSSRLDKSCKDYIRQSEGKKPKWAVLTSLNKFAMWTAGLGAFFVIPLYAFGDANPIISGLLVGATVSTYLARYAFTNLRFVGTALAASYIAGVGLSSTISQLEDYRVAATCVIFAGLLELRRAATKALDSFASYGKRLVLKEAQSQYSG